MSNSKACARKLTAVVCLKMSFLLVPILILMMFIKKFNDPNNFFCIQKLHVDYSVLH